jgi:hypothetical protein
MINRDGILILESAGHQPVGGIGTQTFSLCAQRSCTPLNKRPRISGQNVRWAHRAQPCVP